MLHIFYTFRRKHGWVVPFFRVAKERHHRILPPQAVLNPFVCIADISPIRGITF